MQLTSLSSSKTFSSHQKETWYPLSRHSSFIPSLSPWQPSVQSLSLWIYLFWIFHMEINKIICYVRFCDIYFHSAYFWHSSMLSYIYNNWIIVHHMNKPHFIYSSIYGHLDCFWFLTWISAALNISAQVFGYLCSILWSYIYLGIELLDCMVIIWLKELSNCFLWQLNHFKIPSAMFKCSSSSLPLTNTGYLQILKNNSHSSGCEVLSYCGND